jgi:hypothetical protein
MMAFAQSPQALFGVLIALECGVDPVKLAARLGQGVSTLLNAAEAARAGTMPRQTAWRGERMASEVRAELASTCIRGDELFLTPWHRTAIGLIARPEGAMSAEIAAVLDEFGKVVQGTKLVQRMKATMERAGFVLRVEANYRGMPGSHYFLHEPDRLRMQALIENGWVLP